MFNRCPGVERSPRIELYKCPKCGAEVEIFSNEVKVKCHQCGEMVYSERLPSCIDWCAVGAGVPGGGEVAAVEGTE